MAKARRWAANASPIITLAKVDQLRLVEALCDELVIPSAVQAEIQAGAEDDDPARLWLTSKSDLVQPVDTIEAVIARWDLGDGESHVLHWCRLHPGFEALLDDRAARSCARSLGVPVRGTLGVVVLAKREGLLKRARPVLEEMMQAGFRIDDALLQTALELASE